MQLRPFTWRWFVPIAATVHVVLTALPVFDSVVPHPFLAKARGTVAPYLTALFLNHGYNFYAPEPGVSQTLNVQFTRSGQKYEFWLQDPQLYANDLAFLRHQGLAKAFTVPSAVSTAMAQSVSRFICRTKQADSVRLSWALHPELPRKLANTVVNPNAGQFFTNVVTVGQWLCGS